MLSCYDPTNYFLLCKYAHWIIHYLNSGKEYDIIFVFMFEVFISIFVICQEYCFNRVFIINFRCIELKLINIILTPNISVYDMRQFFSHNFSVLLYQFVCSSTL